MGTISKNFSYYEFEHSDTADAKGICNVINTFAVRDAVKELVETILQPLRDAWGKPININSGYRCPELNDAVGGSKTSAHLTGYAADIVPQSQKEFDRFFNFVKAFLTDNKIPFDQCAREWNPRTGSRWVHIGLYGPRKRQLGMFYNWTKS